MSLDESGLPDDTRGSGDDSSEHPAKKRGNKRDINSEDLARLRAHLDSHETQEGQKYLQIHRRLVMFFECNDCSDPGDLADVVFTVLARKLRNEEIRDVSQFCIGIARQVLRDEWRSQRKLSPIDAHPMGAGGLPDGIDYEARIIEKIDGDRVHACLQRCLRALKPAQRSLILQFHGAEDGQKISVRKELAKTIGVNDGALRVRAFNIRKQLKSCVSECMQSMAEARANLKRRY